MEFLCSGKSYRLSLPTPADELIYSSGHPALCLTIMLEFFRLPEGLLSSRLKTFVV